MRNLLEKEAQGRQSPLLPLNIMSAWDTWTFAAWNHVWASLRGWKKRGLWSCPASCTILHFPSYFNQLCSLLCNLQPKAISLRCVSSCKGLPHAPQFYTTISTQATNKNPGHWSSRVVYRIVTQFGLCLDFFSCAAFGLLPWGRRWGSLRKELWLPTAERDSWESVPEEQRPHLTQFPS